MFSDLSSLFPPPRGEWAKVENPRGFIAFLLGPGDVKLLFQQLELDFVRYAKRQISAKGRRLSSLSGWGCVPGPWETAKPWAVGSSVSAARTL